MNGKAKKQNKKPINEFSKLRCCVSSQINYNNSRINTKICYIRLPFLVVECFFFLSIFARWFCLVFDITAMSYIHICIVYVRPTYKCQRIYMQKLKCFPLFICFFFVDDIYNINFEAV